MTFWTATYRTPLGQTGRIMVPAARLAEAAKEARARLKARGIKATILGVSA